MSESWQKHTRIKVFLEIYFWSTCQFEKDSIILYRDSFSPKSSYVYNGNTEILDQESVD